MIELVSAVLGQLSQGPQLFWLVIAVHLSMDSQYLVILSLHNFLPCICPGRIQRERTMRTVQIVLSPPDTTRHNGTQ
jgi:hypothetical protein